MTMGYKAGHDVDVLVPSSEHAEVERPEWLVDLLAHQHHQLQQLLQQHHVLFTESLQQHVGGKAAVLASPQGTPQDVRAAPGISTGSVAAGGIDVDAPGISTGSVAAGGIDVDAPGISTGSVAAGGTDVDSAPSSAAKVEVAAKGHARFPDACDLGKDGSVLTMTEADPAAVAKHSRDEAEDEEGRSAAVNLWMGNESGIGYLEPIFDKDWELELPMPLKTDVRIRLKASLARIFFSLCIVTNCVVMYVHLQYLGDIANASLGLDNDIDRWGQQTENIFSALEYVFTGIFLIELALNLYVFRRQYFSDLFNVTDCLIVSVTTFEAFVLQPLAADMQNISFLRLLRIAKMFRSLKVFRMLGIFDSLSTLIATILHSTWSLLGSLVIMFAMVLMCSIFLCSALHEFVVDEAADIATRTWVNSLFGSGDKSLYTVFEMTFSGCWPNYASRVVKDVSPFYAGFFALYVTFVIFGLVRIISALFLRDTMQKAARDADIIIRERMKKTRQTKKELKELFSRGNASHDGQLSLQELDVLLRLPKVQLWLGELGIDASDAEVLFELLDHNGDGSICLNEFVEGISKLRGEARSQDLVPMIGMIRRLFGQSKEILQAVEQVAAEVAAEKRSLAKVPGYEL